jgi:WD40 repeat protein/DNA-binding XRE family transcriptional regulator
MSGSSYREYDYTFGQASLTLRTTIGLTQAELARHLDISRKAVGEWEAGLTYPKTEHLKAFITLAAQHHAFHAGREEEEIRAFWHVAHQKTLLDEGWLTGLLPHTEAHRTSQLVEDTIGTASVLIPPARSDLRVDWSDAPTVTTFYGREWDLNLLISWIIEEHCRVVSVLGLGGIGKSALATKVMQQVAERFEVVIWRSLRDAPTCETLLDECLQVLAPEALNTASVSFEHRLGLLLKSMRGKRVLLVFDNLETLLEEGQSMGHMRTSYEGYDHLLRRLAETVHQSCLLLTSREKPSALVPLEGNRALVRALRLARLDVDACKQLLAEKEVTGSTTDYARLVEAYAGNPLALNIIAQIIVDLFGGEIAPFLEQGEVVFGGVRELLDQQYGRLADLERTLLCWLAIIREPVSIEELHALLVVPSSTGEVLEAIDGLHRRSLIERGRRPGCFVLQSVVLEYVTMQIIAEASREIEQGRLVRLIEHGLVLAHTKDYVRQAQERLIAAPLLARLQNATLCSATVKEGLQSLLDQLRRRAQETQGYGPANLIALLREQSGHLRSLDLSRLTIRGAFLQGIEMQDSSLAKANLRETVLNESFDIPWAVAISLNGQHWAIGSRRGAVRVWREAGRLLHLAWQAHTDTVHSLAFSPDGRRLATGSWDGSLKLWDIESGALLWASWFTDNIECLAFSPDGFTISSGGGDATVQLLDVSTGALRKTLIGHNGPVFALAWSPNSRLLASGGTDRVIRLWELSEKQSETSVQLLAGHTNWVLGLAFNPDGTQLASGSWDATVRLWDLESLSLLQTLTGHTERVRAIAWSPDGRLLASCGFDHTIWLWDSAQSSYQTGLHGHSAGVYYIAFSPDSRSLLSGGEDGTLRVWDVERGQCVHNMHGYAVSLYDVSWSPNGTRLASVGSNSLVSIWEVEGLTAPRLLYGHRSLVFGVAWSPDGRLLASSGLDNAVRLWDTSSGDERQVLKDPDHADTLFFGIAWSPDGTQLAATSYQQGVQVWGVTTGTRLWVGRAQRTRIRRVVWSPDGTQLASCGDDGSVCLWKASDGTLLQQFQEHGSIVMSVAWSRDGMRLASGGGSRGSGKFVIWNAQSGERLQAWSEPNSIVNTLVWNETGAVLVSGSSDGKLRWWDAQHGECLLQRQEHQGAVQSLKVSPDYQRLASCGDDNTIQVWNLERGELLMTLRRDRPYERLNITGIKGVTEAQLTTLRALGAIEDTPANNTQRAP